MQRLGTPHTSTCCHWSIVAAVKNRTHARAYKHTHTHPHPHTHLFLHFLVALEVGELVHLPDSRRGSSGSGVRLRVCSLPLHARLRRRRCRRHRRRGRRPRRTASLLGLSAASAVGAVGVRGVLAATAAAPVRLVALFVEGGLERGLQGALRDRREVALELLERQVRLLADVVLLLVREEAKGLCVCV